RLGLFDTAVRAVEIRQQEHIVRAEQAAIFLAAEAVWEPLLRNRRMVDDAASASPNARPAMKLENQRRSPDRVAKCQAAQPQLQRFENQPTGAGEKKDTAENRNARGLRSHGTRRVFHMRHVGCLQTTWHRAKPASGSALPRRQLRQEENRG